MREPGCFACRACHDDKAWRIGPKRLSDQLVRDMRAVVVAGVDVVDSARDSLAQNGERHVVISRRPEHAGSRKVHGPIAHSMNDPASEDEFASRLYPRH